MGRIHVLPEHVANKIAAGEVVERPASVVKELLENSLDAGAGTIQLIIKEAGKAMVRVIDDGSGMSEDDALMSFQRHATSKIESAEDLENMQVGDFQVWVQHGPRALLACVVRGVPPREFGSMIQDRLERVHEQMGAGLEQFRGDATPFEATRPILQSCLTGQLARERRRIPWVLSAAAVLLVLLSATLLFFYFRDQRRWSAYLDRLKAEPGIVIASTESGIRNHRISGLRDSLAGGAGGAAAGFPAGGCGRNTTGRRGRSRRPGRLRACPAARRRYPATTAATPRTSRSTPSSAVAAARLP